MLIPIILVSNVLLHAHLSPMDNSDVVLTVNITPAYPPNLKFESLYVSK